jgi:hypothetical protein
VFIEIEKPKSLVFRDGSNNFHPNFQSALQQIGRWRAWLSEPSNLASFMISISPMHLPAVMRRNVCYPKFVLVHGRRREYEANDTRRAIVRAEERSDFHILSFDSLAESLAQKHECYVGARHNETIEIFGDRLVSPDLFGWIEPTQFVVSAALRNELRYGPPGGPRILRFDGRKHVDALPWVADRIRVSKK